MRKNALRTSFFRTVKGSMGRYLAIALIIALGATLLVGLQTTRDAMVKTLQQHLDSTEFYDFKVQCTYGYEETDVDSLRNLDGIAEAEGGYSADVMVVVGEEESACRLHSLPQWLNVPEVLSGRMPRRSDECLADGINFDESDIGTVITLSETNEEDTLSTVTEREFTIVGIATSPLYVNFERGTTTIGTGKLDFYLYILPECFDLEVYTEVYLRMEGSYDIYSEEYTQAQESLEDSVTEAAETAALRRYTSIYEPAVEALAEGQQEYEDGLAEYETKKAEAEQQLADAEQQIADAKVEIAENEETIAQGKRSTASAQYQISKGYQELEAGQEELDAAVSSVTEQLDATEADLTAKQEEAQQGLEQVQKGLAVLEVGEKILQWTPLAPVVEELQEELKESETEIQDGLSQISDGLNQVAEGRAEAEAQFAEQQTAIDEARTTLNRSSSQLYAALEELRNGEITLEEAKEQVETGEWELKEQKIAADREFFEAEKELREAEEKLADAREQLESMEEPKTYVLDRSTNVGYACFENDADIVKNVSRVFPLFFFLIAALICMTTMDKMIDEERSQIGTMRALGYGDGTILLRYLAYSGSASFVGVLLGDILGTLFIPVVIWQAYGIMYTISGPIAIYVKWGLCALLLGTYLLGILLVTFFSCRRTMRQMPAELILPKAPPAGKRLLMEHLFFWKWLPFLHKVTWRNIFRYRKRFFMTLLGVGGCTALLVTGFGIRDSVMDVADYQFSTLTVYDATVNFSGELTEEEQSRLISGGEKSEYCFLYETSVDLDTDTTTRSTTLAVPADTLEGFWNLTSEGEALELPEKNDVLVAKGLADTAGLQVGDEITLRTADMKVLELTVSGIFDNNVYTYCIVSPETVEAQWGECPGPQVAFLNIEEGEDQDAIAADLLEEENVLNVSLTQATLRWVDNAMSSMNAIVYLIVFMAAGLAFIVLYNLTNMNMNERLRELATIQVLGFRSHETASYLSRESLLLSLMGSALGLLLGKYLHAFVMAQVRIDMMHFDVRITTGSYVISLALTMVFAVAINLALTPRLRRINMAEALKANE